MHIIKLHQGRGCGERGRGGGYLLYVTAGQAQMTA